MHSFAKRPAGYIIYKRNRYKVSPGRVYTVLRRCEGNADSAVLKHVEG